MLTARIEQLAVKGAFTLQVFGLTGRSEGFAPLPFLIPLLFVFLCPGYVLTA